MNSIVSAVMTGWEFPFAERVEDQLKEEWYSTGETLVCGALRLRKMRETFHGQPSLREEGLGLLRDPLSSAFKNLCYVCNQVIQSDVFTALNKAWCVNHFACSACDQKMTVKTKFYEVDLKPVCKKCYDKYPRDLRLRLKKYHESEAARDQRQASV